MSHFISYDKYVNSHPIIPIPHRDVIGSKYKNVLRDTRIISRKGEKKYFMNIFKDLSTKEKDLIRKKN